MTVYVRRIEACQVDVMVQNLNVDLPAVRMSGKSKVPSLLRRNREDVGIVRKQDVERIGRDQIFGALQIMGLRAHLLVVDSGDIHHRIAEAELPRLAAQKRNA